MEITGRLSALWHLIPSELLGDDRALVSLRRALTYAFATDQYRASEMILGVAVGYRPVSELTRLSGFARDWRPHTIEYDRSWSELGQMTHGEFLRALRDLASALRRLARARR